MNDQTLLDDYRKTGSQAAFTRLVERYLPLVLGAARRRLGAESQAEDVAQQVFVLLARKGRNLGGDVVLAGWLYRAAVHLASETNRRERRRREREQAAVDRLENSPADAGWREIEPSLDAMMARLNQADQDALLLRYFENRPLREVGATLGLGEDAAQKRVARALERLRRAFVREGVSLSGGALASAMALGALKPASAGVAAGLSSAAFAAATGAVAVKTAAFSLMSITTMKSALGVATVLTAVGIIAVQTSRLTRLQKEHAALRTTAIAAQQEATRLQTKLADARRPRMEDPEKLELLRLRGEATQRRQQNEALSEENRQLLEELDKLARAEQSRLEAGDVREEALERKRQMGMARLNYTKQWMLALHLYESEHGGMPANLTESGGYFGEAMAADSSQIDTEAYRQLTPEQFELIYRGSLNEVAEPDRTIVLREKQAWPDPDGQGWRRAYGFADGHSEVRYSPDGDFTAWEADRMLPAPPDAP